MNIPDSAMYPQFTGGGVIEFVEKSELMTVKVCEILQRDWKVNNKIARPEHRMLGHTAFLVFQRNI